MNRKSNRIAGVRLVILDLDDTLLDTGKSYFNLIVELAGRMSEMFGGRVAADEVIHLQAEIDIQEVSNLGFTCKRFPASFVRTYRALCDRFGASPDSSVEEECAALAEKVYLKVPEFLDGAEGALEYLKKKYTLSLYTLGEKDQQEKKIEFHRLRPHFKEVHILPEKTEDTLRGIANGFPPATVAVIGDSLRGEIAPAVRLGFHAVHIHRENGWPYLNVPVEGPYFKIHSIREIKNIL